MDNALDKIEEFRKVFDKVVAVDDNKEEFKVLLNALMNLHDASKPEIVERHWSNEKFTKCQISEYTTDII